MDDLRLYWNYALHPETLSTYQKEVLNNNPYLCYLHDCLFDVPNDIAIAPAMRNGVYEYFEVKQILRTLKAGDSFLDIGACVGLYSVLASKAVGDTGKVIAVEPNDISYIHKNFALNECKNCSIYKMAIGKSVGRSFLHIDADNFGNHCVTGDTSGTPISIIDIDSIASDLQNIRVIKMDTQGDELNALLGARKTIAKNKSLSMLVEVAPKHLIEKGQDFVELVSMIDEYKFDIAVFAPKMMDQDCKSINFALGFDLLRLEKNQYIDFMKWELDRNENFFCNLWCFKP